MNPNRKRAMEVVDSVSRRELDRSLQASLDRRKAEQEEPKTEERPEPARKGEAKR